MQTQYLNVTTGGRRSRFFSQKELAGGYRETERGRWRVRFLRDGQESVPLQEGGAIELHDAWPTIYTGTDVVDKMLLFYFFFFLKCFLLNNFFVFSSFVHIQVKIVFEEDEL